MVGKVARIARVGSCRGERSGGHHRACRRSTNYHVGGTATRLLERKPFPTCRAAKDERISRLQDFFENDSVESSLFIRPESTLQEAGQPRAAAAPLAESGARSETPVGTDSVTQTNQGFQADCGTKSAKNTQSSRSNTSSSYPQSDSSRSGWGKLRLADPRETVLRTLESYQSQLRARLHRFSPLSVSLPSSESLPIPAVVRGVALDSKHRVAVAFGAAALLILARVMSIAKKSRAAAEIEEKERALRARRGEKQRERFRQMFAGEDGVDASVFSAVRQKGENATVSDAEAQVEPGSQEDLEDVEASMDEEIKRAYKDFVKNSKLGEGEFWNIDDEVEAFEKIEIDFDDDE